MRVMWFTNIQMPAMDRRAGRKTVGSGWWMSSLLDKLREQSDIKLAVVAALPAWEAAEFSEDGVDYFVLPQSKIVEKFSVPARLALRGNVERCAAIVRRWKPDLLHVHGTERFYGLMKAWGLVDAPMVVSIQGLMGPCARKALGELFPGELLATYGFRDLLRGGALARSRSFRRAAVWEAKIIRAADGVIGRTDMDRAWTWAIRPDGTYYHGDEMMRPAFFQTAWNIDQCRRHHVLSTTGPSPLKGVHVLVEAMRILHQSVPAVKLSIAAAGMTGNNGYARFIRRQIARAGLSRCVDMLGWLDADALAGRMKDAHCFVTPSFMENSSNSLSEAMLVGMPCVTTCAGGLASLMEDRREGLHFPPGDPAFLAHRVFEVFQDDGLACRLGAAARQRASSRHDPERIVRDVLAAYENVLTKSVREPVDVSAGRHTPQYAARQQARERN